LILPVPINLRSARKAKAKNAKEQEATQNRLTYGRSKSDKAHTKAKADLQTARFAGLQLIKTED
jgi:hypothetical protein